MHSYISHCPTHGDFKSNWPGSVCPKCMEEYRLNQALNCPHGNPRFNGPECQECKNDRLKKIDAELWPHKSILVEAESLVNGDRQAAYGTPEENFGRWSALCKTMGIQLEPHQLAMVMVLGKLARQVNKHKRDNFVDAGGYLELAFRLWP